MELTTIATPGLWLGFTGMVVALLVIDLGIFHRTAHAVTPREAATWSVVWVGLAMAFNGWIVSAFGTQRGLEFLTGYLIEKALAVDNIFVFLVIFSSFAVPAVQQHRVLYWGIFGALVMRAVFIGLGAALLTRYHWVMYLFGAFLLVTGIKLFVHRDEETHPEENVLFRVFRRVVPSVGEYHGSRFFVRLHGRWVATPLLMVLVCIEMTDLVFAVDSIPAIFAVTTDPFIVYTSNIFAILGLRSMFFLLQGAMDRFHYLKVGLAGVLTFVGTKMLIAGVVKVPIGLSLGVIAGILGTAILASWLRSRPQLARSA